jgi:hypothetical protein
MKFRIVALYFLLFTASCTVPEAVSPGSLSNLTGSYASEKIILFPEISMQLNFSFDKSGKNGKFVAQIKNISNGNNYTENIGGDFENLAENPAENLIIEKFPIPSSTGLYFVEGSGLLKKTEGILSTVLHVTKRNEFEKYHINFRPSGSN